MKKWIIAIAMVVASALAMATSLTDGLVGYWPFDGDAKDYSGNGNHGTTHGVSLASDRRGNASSAYHFDGSDYISVPASSSLDNISSAITVGAWIKPTAWDNHKENGGNLPAWIPVLQKGNESRVQFQFMHARDGATTWVRIDGSQGGSIENATMPTLGVWQFVALTLDSGYLKYYRNGSLSDSQYVGVTLNQDNDTLFIGVDPWVIWEYFTGNIDEVIIYNRALSSSEILALYNGGLKVCKIAFDVNGGAGSMNELQTLSGKMTTLPANQFARDGYVFLGWALAPDGEVVYRDGEEIEVDSDMTLYAVWANPALTLAAESADWSSGSITLRCEDADTSGATHTYCLEYLDENNAWVAAGGASAANVAVSADGFAHLTDGNFCSRLDGIKTVSYRVKDENGRVSEPCVTRNRYLLSIGYSAFLTKNTPKQGHYNDASEIRRLCVERGGFSSENARFRNNSGATTEKVRAEMSYFASQTQPGDVFVFYIATHGGDYDSKHNALLATYDGGYQVKDLLTDVRNFSSNVAVINIIMSCHSFALTGGVNVNDRINQWLVACGFGQCLGNVAWVTSCDAQQSSYTYLDEDHSRFGQSFIVNGFGQGCADMKLYGTEYSGGNVDGFITLGELSRYSTEFFKGLSDAMPSSVQMENDGLLDSIVFGRRTGSPSWSRPEAPSGVTASQGDTKINISWTAVANATSYQVYRYPLDSPGEFKWIGISGGLRFPDETATLTKEYGYRIKAVNPVGMSDFSSVAISSRGTSKFIEFLDSFFGIATASADEYDAMEKMPAANGCRTVGECYALGIDPEDPNDDFRISNFEMKDGKPVISLNHTEDGSGNSFLPLIRTLGAKSLGASTQWDDVTDIDDPGSEGYRFFKVKVELP